MIDIHCHLLPGIDDGARTLEDALALARACVADNITHVVATPHVFPGRFDNLRANIAEAFERFRTLIDANAISLTLSWAGEVRLTPEVLDLIDADEIPFLGESEGFRNLLLELPDGQIPLGSENFVHLLLQHNIRPVIVHLERNRAVMERPERILPFIDAGCCLQVTAGSVVGQFGERSMQTAWRMLDEGWVTALASDAHNLTGRRPRMSEARLALGERYGVETAFDLLCAAPARLCGLQPPPAWNAVERDLVSAG